MRDRPHGAALLDVARKALLDEVAPTLKGQPRYVALMVANVLGIVSREIEQVDRVATAWDSTLARVSQKGGADVEASFSHLIEAMRAGRYDADEALYGALVETAEVAASIWKPAKAGAASA